MNEGPPGGYRLPGGEGYLLRRVAGSLHGPLSSLSHSTKLTAIMSPGHFGPSLAAKLTGSNALGMICRLDPDMAHTASTAKRAVT